MPYRTKEQKEQDKQKKRDMEMELARQEEERLRRLREGNAQETGPQAEDNVAMGLKPNATQASDWNEVVKSYKKKFPQLKIAEDGTLTFPDRESADAFFTEQAKKHVFLATWVVNGELQDDHFYSCGNGKLYKGSFAHILEALNQDLAAEHDSKKKETLEKGIEHLRNMMPKESNLTADHRSKLQEYKGTAAEEPQSASSLRAGQPKKL